MKLFSQSVPLLVLLALTFPQCVVAHGDLHERIEEVTAQLESNPNDARLLFKRGSLYEQHGDHATAIVDFVRVEELDSAMKGLRFAMARSYFGAHQFEASLLQLDRIEKPESEDGRVMLWRGRVLSKLGRNDEAVASFREAFSSFENVSPDLCIEFARMIASAGEEHYPEAIAGLDQAIERIGPVITLNLAALDLEEAAGLYDNALRRVNRMLKPIPDLAALLTRKGDVLTKLGRKDEATAAYSLALESIESLPPSRRKTDATMKLEEQLRARLQ